jgi:hypothetical protein
MGDSMSKLCIATFNLKNFDDKPNQRPTLKERISYDALSAFQA